MNLLQAMAGVLLLVVYILFATVSLFLQETGMQYIVAVLLIMLGGAAFISIKNKLLTWIDAGWIISALVSVLYVIYAILIGREITIVSWQALMFLMPFTQYLTWYIKPKITPSRIASLLLLACILKLPVFIIYSDEVLASLQSISGRARFHDYISIVLIFCILPALLYFKDESNIKKIALLVFFVVYLITAAHRSAYLAVFVQFLVWYFFYTGVNKVLKLRIAVVLLGLTFSFLFFTPSGRIMLDLFTAASNGVDGNSIARMDLSGGIIDGWISYFWGHGFGNEYMYGVDSKGDAVFYALQHNSFLTPLYYLGVIPFLAYIISFIYLVLMPIRGNLETLYLRSALTGMGVFAYFNLWFENPLFALPYWLLFGWLKLSNIEGKI